MRGLAAAAPDRPSPFAAPHRPADRIGLGLKLAFALMPALLARRA
ncbi:MAG: hypothetical protein NZM27_06305 [Acetobacteraceae bacterium]|nr:hypothetical protein [Acetobacteraceae bacterium]MCX7683676.1 hypothetical protein [Acetobacteraceae bacterium]MDW8398238.1 hypothetical protein [Acetobacteraceae bacterium]